MYINHILAIYINHIYIYINNFLTITNGILTVDPSPSPGIGPGNASGFAGKSPGFSPAAPRHGLGGWTGR